MTTKSRSDMKLRDYRKLRGITQTQAAAELGTSPANVSRWEAGQVMPRPQWINKIVRWSGRAVTALDLCPEVFES